MSDLFSRLSGAVSGGYNNYLAPNLSAAGETIGEYCTIIASSRMAQGTRSVANSFFGVVSNNYPSALKFSWSTGTAVSVALFTTVALMAFGWWVGPPPRD